MCTCQDTVDALTGIKGELEKMNISLGIIAGSGGTSAPQPIEILSDISDGFAASVDEENLDYSAARNGTAQFIGASAPLYLGQAFAVGEYFVYESFLNFNLLAAGCQAGQTCSEVHLSLCCESDQSTTDFVAEVRAKNWGDSFPTDISTVWVAGGNLAALPLLASLSTAGLATGIATEFVENGTALKDAVTAALAGDGVLRMMIVSSRTTNNVTPTGDEYVSFGARDSSIKPKLTVTAS
jgi:hypothetical protein